MAITSYTSGWSAAQGDRGLGRLYAGLLVPALILYCLTAQRSFAWQDSGVFQWRILRFELFADSGLAVSHPLLILLGNLFAWLVPGPLAFRANLVSAVFAAIAAANVGLLVRRVSPGRPAAAWLAGAMFALAHTIWFNAALCESQAILAALLTTELHVLLSLCQRPRPQLAALLGFINGLALTAHNQALLALPIYVLVVVSLCADGRLRWRAAAAMAVCWAIGSSLYLGMIVSRAGQWGWGAAVQSALFGGTPGHAGWQASVLGGSARTVQDGLAYVAYNFPHLGLVLALVGIVRALQVLPGRYALALLGLTIVHYGFALTYRVPDQFMFFTASYALTAILAGLGLGGPREYSGRRRRWVIPATALTLAFTPILYAAAPSLVERLGVNLPFHHEAPFRDPARYWLVPWKNNEDSAERFARAALAQAGRGSVIIADGSSYYPLVLVQATTSLGREVTVLHVGQATPENVVPGLTRAYVVSNKPNRHPAWLDAKADLRPRPPATQTTPPAPPEPLIRVDWHAEEVATPPAGEYKTTP